MKRKAGGFTLLELMLAMAILVLIVSMAMPSMTGFVQRNRISAEVRGLVGAVALARSEAISQRTRFAVIPRVAADGWNSGWQVTEVDSAGAAVGTASRTSSPYPTGYTLTFSPVATALEFNSRGILNLPATVEITMNDGNGNSRVIHLPLSGSAYIR